jgi:hypothetical protein
MTMFIETVRNRNSPPCILLRETFRINGKVRHRTLANLTNWPKDILEGFRALLEYHRNPKAHVPPSSSHSFKITRSLPHGHVAAVLSVMRKLGIPKLLGSKGSPERDLCMAMIATRILFPASKLATSRALARETLNSTLAAECGLKEDPHENDLYAAMDWLLPRQSRIEKVLARRHLDEGSLVLYDLSSSYFEGTQCPLAKLGYSRDGKNGKLQIEYGLLCNRSGIPVAIEVFEGNTADPATLGVQIDKLRKCFGLRRLILVGDRGMITQARIDGELRGIEGLDWITALRSSQIAALAREGLIEASLFDEKNLAEPRSAGAGRDSLPQAARRAHPPGGRTWQIQSPDFPDERLVVCRNPLLALSRAHKREELLCATEADLLKIRNAVTRTTNPLRGRAKIGLRVGRIINKHKMAKHFSLTIADDAFEFVRRQEKIAAEAAIDGIYVVRTSSREADLESAEIVECYKDLGLVEQAFRSIKTVDLKIRPIHHRNADRVRSHVLLCMLAYYVEWHMRSVLKPVLFDQDDAGEGRELRADPVMAKRPSASAKAKARTKRTADGLPVHSFQSLLEDMATITRNTIVPDVPNAPGWQQDTEPTPLQIKILSLLDSLPASSQ